MNTTTDTGAIAAKLEQHRQAAAQLQHQLEQQQAVEQAAREQRLQVYDKQTVDGFPAEEEALRTEEQQAREAFTEAVKADPMLAAWTAYRAAYWRRYHLRSHVAQAGRNVGVEDGPNDLAYRDPRLFEDVLQTCEDTARDIAEMEMMERTNARTDAGEGKAASS